MWFRSRSKREENQPCTLDDRAELRWRRRGAGGAGRMTMEEWREAVKESRLDLVLRLPGTSRTYCCV